MTDNREVILSAALELWVDRGYEAVGVQQICTDAQVTKPTLYHYFGSKAGLLRAIVDLNDRRLAEFVPSQSFDPSDVPGSIERVCVGWLGYVEAYPRLARLFISHYYGPRGSKAATVAGQQQGRWIGRLECFFNAAAEFHGNLRNRARAYAASFAGLLLTYGFLAVNGADPLQRDLPYVISKQFMYGIFS